MENETQLFNKRLLNRQKICKPLLGKIPKCIKNLKNVSIPKNINNKNIHKRSLLPSKQSSTSSLKNTNYNSKKSSARKSIPFMQACNVHSSFQNFKQKIQKKNQKNNIFNRIFSSEKSRSEKNDESSCTSRRNINIDHLYNFKIEYYLLKDNIQKILKNQIDKNNIDITNKLMEEVIIKLKKILDKTNEHIAKSDNNNNNSDNNDIKELDIKEGYNKKLLSLYEEKYNKECEKLKIISNKSYIDNINKELEEIQNEIDCIEKENIELLLDNNTHKNFNTITLPNIKKINGINNINQFMKNEQNINMEKQLYSRLKEYKNHMAQEILISKKIKDNEISQKKYEDIINNLNIKYNTLQNNYEKGIYTEEDIDITNEYNNINIDIKDNLPIININNNINNKISLIDEQVLKEKDKNKKKPKNELVLIEKKRIYKINKNNGLEPLLDKNSNVDISKSKETNNKNTITIENHSKFEDNHNILSLPYPTSKKKNLSCANVTSNINISKNKTIKELILKNLDQKEKEEKTLINIHENDTFSSNKYKHIKLKPNFSFNNDYHLFKDEKIKKIPKMQSSVENKNNIIVNLYNNKDKEELINESIYIDESSGKNLDNNKNNDNIIKDNDDNNINIITDENNTNNNNSPNDKNRRIFKMRKIPELMAKNNGNNIKFIQPNKNNQINNEEKKNDRFSTYGGQREKVLNTIMYDDIVEQGSII